jgi:hypothetical protein
VLDEQPSVVLSEALELVQEEDPPLRARLQARLAVSLYYWPGTEERRKDLVEQAIAAARRLDDPATLAHVLYNAQHVTWGPDTTERDLGWMDEVLRLNQVVGDPQLELAARNRRIDLLVELGDLVEADRTLETLETLELAATKGADPRTGAYVRLQRARAAVIAGRYGEAERLNAEAAAQGARLQDRTVITLAGIQLVTLRWQQERLAEVETEIRRGASGSAAFAWPAFLAMTCSRLGHEEEARRQLERLGANGFSDLPRYDGWMIAMASLSEVCAGLGDAARAAQIYELLLPFASRNAIVGQSAFAGPVSRFLGILAGVCGRRDVAEDHFRAACDAAKRLNAPGVLLRVDIDEAQMLAASDRPGHRERALELLGGCADLARRLGLESVGTLVDRRRSALAGEEAEAPAPAARTQPAAPETASLQREGDVWAFDFGRRSLRVRDSKGVRCLAVLLANPGVEIHAAELARPEGSGPAESAGRLDAARLELAAIGSDDAGPLLDAEAKAAYRHRLDELRDDIEEAESFNDPERAAQARKEMDFLVRELAGAVGLGGRDRKAASSAERARVSVTKAIRTTIRRVAEHDPDLGRELDATVRTGTFCVYEPDPRHPLAWRVDAG